MIQLAGYKLKGSISTADILKFLTGLGAISTVVKGLILAEELLVAIEGLPHYDRDT
jgi:hypothetical protein